MEKPFGVQLAEEFLTSEELQSTEYKEVNKKKVFFVTGCALWYLCSL